LSTPEPKPDWARDLPDATPDGEPIAYGARPLSPRIRLVSVEPGDPAPVLLVVFADGAVRRLSLAALVERVPVAPLRDFEEAARATVMPYGHGVEWACGADAPADFLYEEGEPVEHVVRFAEPAPTAA
jgi:hypothetical protein